MPLQPKQIHEYDEISNLLVDALDVFEVERQCLNGRWKNYKKTGRSFYIVDCFVEYIKTGEDTQFPLCNNLP
jgi:hypothetical protein